MTSANLIDSKLKDRLASLVENVYKDCLWEMKHPSGETDVGDKQPLGSDTVRQAKLSEAAN
jgi:hypothetical protein